jgi:hypothetical protein
VKINLRELAKDEIDAITDEMKLPPTDYDDIIARYEDKVSKIISDNKGEFLVTGEYSGLTDSDTLKTIFPKEIPRYTIGSENTEERKQIYNKQKAFLENIKTNIDNIENYYLLEECVNAFLKIANKEWGRYNLPLLPTNNKVGLRIIELKNAFIKKCIEIEDKLDINSILYKHRLHLREKIDQSKFTIQHIYGYSNDELPSLANSVNGDKPEVRGRYLLQYTLSESFMKKMHLVKKQTGGLQDVTILYDFFTIMNPFINKYWYKDYYDYDTTVSTYRRKLPTTFSAINELKGGRRRFSRKNTMKTANKKSRKGRKQKKHTRAYRFKKSANYTR